jgi:hypothetical protein
VAESAVLIIPYGTGTAPGDAAGAPVVTIEPQKRLPLRLNNAPYAFPEPPDPIRLARLEERLDFLHEHLTSFCGLWDRLPRLFLTLYFRAIATAIERNRKALLARAAAAGGLFDYRDWSFSALRPLPAAQLPLPGEAGFIRADIAFWTGTALLAVEILGSAGVGRARQAERAALRQGGVSVVELAGSALQREGEAALAGALPAPFWNFWESETLPSSPFGRAALDEILVESGPG